MAQAYNQEAFRYFLTAERRRSERSRQSFLLVLVRLRKAEFGADQIPPAVAGTVFSALKDCVREVDFIGWFREGRVAGAVLTQGTQAPPTEAYSVIGARISETLAATVPQEIGDRLHVRILEMRSGRVQS